MEQIKSEAYLFEPEVMARLRRIASRLYGGTDNERDLGTDLGHCIDEAHKFAAGELHYKRLFNPLATNTD